jgi:hypothetical protein
MFLNTQLNAEKGIYNRSWSKLLLAAANEIGFNELLLSCGHIICRHVMPNEGDEL